MKHFISRRNFLKAAGVTAAASAMAAAVPQASAGWLTGKDAAVTILITLISNSFFADTVKSTLGVMFNGDWGSDDTKKIFGADGALKTNIYHDVNGDDMTFGNKVMRTLGMVSVAYTLGTTDAKVLFNDKVMKIDGTAV